MYIVFLPAESNFFHCVYKIIKSYMLEIIQADTNAVNTVLRHKPYS